MADALGLDELKAHALATNGTAKSLLGNPTGVADLERALEIALDINSPLAGAIVNNLATAVPVGDGGLLRTEELFAESARLAERFGDGQGLRFFRGNMVWLDWVRGRWDDSLENANRFVAECEAGSPHVDEGYVRVNRASIRLERGDVDGALADHTLALELEREMHPELLAAVSAISAGNHAELEDGTTRAGSSTSSFPSSERTPRSLAGRAWSHPMPSTSLSERSYGRSSRPHRRARGMTPRSYPSIWTSAEPPRSSRPCRARPWRLGSGVAQAPI